MAFRRRRARCRGQGPVEPLTATRTSMIRRPMIALANERSSAGEYALIAAGSKQPLAAARLVRIGHARGKLKAGSGDGFTEPGDSPSAIASRAAPHDPGGVASLVNRFDQGSVHIARQSRLCIDGRAQHDVIEKRIQCVRSARSTISHRGRNRFQCGEQMGNASRRHGGGRRLCGGLRWRRLFGRDHGINPSRKHGPP